MILLRMRVKKSIIKLKDKSERLTKHKMNSYNLEFFAFFNILKIFLIILSMFKINPYRNIKK